MVRNLISKYKNKTRSTKISFHVVADQSIYEEWKNTIPGSLYLYKRYEVMETFGGERYKDIHI
jgi:hypothetical protein